MLEMRKSTLDERQQYYKEEGQKLYISRVYCYEFIDNYQEISRQL